MNTQTSATHTQWEEQLPLYVAGQLAGDERLALERHLADCAVCQDDLALWRAVAGEVTAANRASVAPPGLAERALDRATARTGFAAAWQRVSALLTAQALLVPQEMWPVSALVMSMGVIVALVAREIDVFYFFAPLLTAACLAIFSGPDHDAALELTRATPTAPWKILLARMSIVSGYNLLLALGATLALLTIVPPGVLGTLILGWFAPMAFLSALALLLCLWIGSGNAILITYGLWLMQYFPYQAIEQWMVAPVWEPVMAAYRQFWRSPALLLALAGLMAGIALWSANRPGIRLSQETG